MKQLWVHREIDVPAHEMWTALVDPQRWPEWGPSVRRATIDDPPMRAGTTGSVTTALGAVLPFEVTAYDEGRHWAWKVAGLTATDHTLEPLDPDRCRVGFGVPWPAAPYLAVCRSALRRLEVVTSPDVVR